MGSPARYCDHQHQQQNAAYDFDTVDHTASDAGGAYAIGYFSADSSEDWRDDYVSFPAEVKGNVLDGWAGENWLDHRNIAVLRPIIEERADVAKSKGSHAIDRDNLDSFPNDSSFPLTEADQIAYNKMLAEITHARDIAYSSKTLPISYTRSSRSLRAASSSKPTTTTE